MEPGGASAPIRPGGRFADLEIGERLGTGAFSSVYRARDTLLGREVALKVLNPQSPWGEDTTKDQMLAEARMIASLQGAHVVTLYRVHELSDGMWAFEMECMSEGDLASRLEEGVALPLQETERIVRAILEALSAAHDQGIIHHDIKPENVLLGRSGEVKLADFGLGRFTREGHLSLSSDRRMRGTPLFMAPEIAIGTPGHSGVGPVEHGRTALPTAHGTPSLPGSVHRVAVLRDPQPPSGAHPRERAPPPRRRLPGLPGEAPGGETSVRRRDPEDAGHPIAGRSCRDGATAASAIPDHRAPAGVGRLADLARQGRPRPWCHGGDPGTGGDGEEHATPGVPAPRRAGRGAVRSRPSSRRWRGCGARCCAAFARRCASGRRSEARCGASRRPASSRISSPASPTRKIPGRPTRRGTPRC